MFYHQATNTYIREGAAFTLNGTQYPDNWLNLSTPDDKAAHGLVEVVTVGAREDERTHFVAEELVDGELRIINTPKPAEMLTQRLNSDTFAEIAAIELGQARAVREAALGRPEYLQSIESRIVALRGRIVKTNGDGNA
jgi:hypothetical protein